MNVKDAFPSKYLKAEEDITEEEPLTVTIKSVGMEEFNDNGKKANKFVLHFREVEKGLVLNKTNTTTVAKLYGDETDEWIAKRITLYATEVQFQAEMVWSIRVRSKVPAAPRAGSQRAVAAPVAAAPTGPPNADGDDSDIPF